MKRTLLIAAVLALSVQVWGADLPKLRLAGPRFATGEANVALEFSGGDLSSLGDFSATLSYKGEETTENFQQREPGSSSYPHFLKLAEKIEGQEGETVAYTVTVVHSSGELKAEGKVTFIPSSGHSKKIVGEEATGTWCGNCVRGAVGMNTLRELYGEQFIGIAGHFNDPMQCEYIGYLREAGYADAYPMVALNRRFAGLDPYYGAAMPNTGGNTSLAEILAEEAAIASVELSGEWESRMSAVKVRCKSDWVYAEDGHEYRYSFIVIENNVHVPDNNGYNQTNTLSGQERGGIWAEWESKPPVIPAADMWYQEVARGVCDFYGIPGSCNSVAAGATTEFEYDVPVPSAVLDGREMEIVVLLLDYTTGEIVNASVLPFVEITYGSLMPEFYCGVHWNLLPEGVVTYDADNQTPHGTMPVKQGEGWITWYDSQDMNWLLLSTSYYNQVATSDDWIVMPAITIPTQNPALSWRARSTSAVHPDGYEVVVATGNSLGELRQGEVIETVNAEAGEWTDRKVSLQKFGGQKVFIAFRNNTFNGECLHIDDIAVQSADPVSLQTTTAARPYHLKHTGQFLNIYFNGRFEARLTHISGITLKTVSGKDIVSIPTDYLKGVMILEILSDGRRYSEKIVL